MDWWGQTIKESWYKLCLYFLRGTQGLYGSIVMSSEAKEQHEQYANTVNVAVILCSYHLYLQNEKESNFNEGNRLLHTSSLYLSFPWLQAL